MTTAEELSAFAPLATLDRGKLDTLARAGRNVGYPAGQRLITEGRRADRCWLLRSGCVAVDAALPGRESFVVQTLGPGDLLGWSWLVPPYRWHFGAVTTEPVQAIEFDAARLADIADADPKFGYTLTLLLFEALVDRLQATRARLLNLYRNPGEAATTAPLRRGESGGGR
ncbi:MULTISPECIES: Crp/Fnr family transcriptional regulator [Nocardia]|uniref:Cyclic nucleotide-binding domain-containing protein n=2 Tax=Nocardia TaxID=1817 RepID=A0A2T2YTI2_9NOCA|nr:MULTISPECIES: cyclic nucleotide-binding domain-containing protein [Nocardia]MBF6447818.1 cyclic nucleotide-binding domain-containing protein [Nocardia elegans]PSR58835.1 cyclic nucleotide-binding domain-containing protein [Nocardia nova]